MNKDIDHSAACCGILGLDPRKHTGLIIWLILWAVIFITINFCDLFYPDRFFTSVIKVSSIGLCLFYVIINYWSDKILILAMLTTLIADIILAIDNTSIFGVIFFLITQIIHSIRLLQPNSQKFQKPILCFLLLSAILIVLAVTTNFIPPMFAIASLYIFALSTNVYISNRWRKENPKNLRANFAFYGFILFLSCDLCVGVSYLSLTAVLPKIFYMPANFLAWFFYYPAQILLSNSTKHDKMVTKERNLC